MYELLVGVPPFQDKSKVVMFKLIKEAKVNFSEKLALSENCKDIIK